MFGVHLLGFVSCVWELKICCYNWKYIVYYIWKRILYWVAFARRITNVWCSSSRFCFMCLRIKNMLFQFTFSFLERERKYVAIENILCTTKEEFYIALLLMFCLIYLTIDNTWFEFTFSLLKLKEKKVSNFEDFTFVSFFQFLNLIISHRWFEQPLFSSFCTF